MSVEYDTEYYYNDPEKQLNINLERIRDEILVLIETECKSCDKKNNFTIGVTSSAGLQTKNTHIELLKRLSVGVSSAEVTPNELLTREGVISRASNANIELLQRLGVGVSSKMTSNDLLSRAPDANTELLQGLGFGVSSKTPNVLPRDNLDANRNANIKILQRDWSFEISCLNMEVDGNLNRNGRLKLKALERVTSETVEEFFKSIRNKHTVKCS